MLALLNDPVVDMFRNALFSLGQSALYRSQGHKRRIGNINRWDDFLTTYNADWKQAAQNREGWNAILDDFIAKSQHYKWMRTREHQAQKVEFGTGQDRWNDRFA